jgi:hypothetical protein
MCFVLITTGNFVMSCGVNTCVCVFDYNFFLLLAQDIFVIFLLFLLSCFFLGSWVFKGEGDERCMNMTPNTIYLYLVLSFLMTRECLLAQDFKKRPFLRSC